MGEVRTFWLYHRENRQEEEVPLCQNCIDWLAYMSPDPIGRGGVPEWDEGEPCDCVCEFCDDYAQDMAR